MEDLAVNEENFADNCAITSIESKLGTLDATLESPDVDLSSILQEEVNTFRAGLVTSTTTPTTHAEDVPFLITVRCRPIIPTEIDLNTDTTDITASNSRWECITIPQSQTDTPSNRGLVYIHKEQTKAGLKTGRINTKEYKLDRTYGPNETTETIYNYSVEPILAAVLNETTSDTTSDTTSSTTTSSTTSGRGYIIAYGQTGSGKTHTISSITKAVINQHSHNIKSFTYYEVRGSKCYNTMCEGEELIVRVNEFGDEVVCGLRKEYVNSEAELTKLVNKAEGLRRTATTVRNGFSSRSHAFCALEFANGGVLTLVDLAGSEGKGDAWGHGVGEMGEERLKEMKEINGSLGDLKECIRLNLLKAKGEGGNGHVPYRRSLLTRLLRRGMEGAPGVKSLFIACVGPLRGSLAMTENTIRYASYMVERTNLEKEKETFKGVESWSGKKVSKWVGMVEGGKYKRIAEYMVISGKQLKIMWRGDVIKRICAAGGSEADAEWIYDKFHEIAKRGANKGEKKGNKKTQGEGGKKELYAPMGGECVENSGK